MRKKTTKSAKVRQYLMSNPNATPKDVGAKFKCAMPMVYAIRKQVLQGASVETEVPAQSNADLAQVGGDHYKSMSVQPWVAMQSWMSSEQFIGFLQGNAIKYLARYSAKGGLEDVRKAQHYINKMIEVMGD